MMVITQFADLSLAPTLRALIPAGQEGVVRAFDWISSVGFRSVQLDAAVSGLRPRELSDRARKDLVAAMSRRGLMVAGVDLFIPRKHYTDPAHVDRAMAVTVEAIGLAHDLGRVPMHLALPVKGLAGDVKSALLEAADGRGVRLAVQCEDQLVSGAEWVSKEENRTLGISLDPATLLALGLDPVKTVHQHAGILAGARLSDALLQAEGTGESGSVGSGIRCAVGEGELDVMMYRLALDLVKGRSGPVVLDLRGLAQPGMAAVAGKKAWDGASFGK
jgi:sugar phosphate isomerase/epimerase